MAKTDHAVVFPTPLYNEVTDGIIEVKNKLKEIDDYANLDVNILIELIASVCSILIKTQDLLEANQDLNTVDV